MLVERGHEHDQRRGLQLELRCHFKAAEAGHLDVEEGDVRLQPLDRCGRAQPIFRFADDLHVWLLVQPALQLAARGRLVVGNQHSHHACCSCHGSVTAASTESGSCVSCSFARSPYSTPKRSRQLRSPTPPGPFATGMEPVLRTATYICPPSRRASISIRTVSRLRSTPCLKAFSNRGCSNIAGMQPP